MEKDIKRKILDATAPVPPRLWDELESRINPNVSRKPIFFYWAVAASILLVLSFAFLGVVRSTTGGNNQVASGNRPLPKAFLTPDPPAGTLKTTTDANSKLAAASHTSDNESSTTISPSVASTEVNTEGKTTTPKSSQSKLAPSALKSIFSNRPRPKLMPNRILPAPIIIAKSDSTPLVAPDQQSQLTSSEAPFSPPTDSAIAATSLASTDTLLNTQDAIQHENVLAYADPESITLKPGKDEPVPDISPKSKVQKLKRFFSLAGQVATGELTARNALKQEGVDLELRIPLPN